MEQKTMRAVLGGIVLLFVTTLVLTAQIIQLQADVRLLSKSQFELQTEIGQYETDGLILTEKQQYKSLLEENKSFLLYFRSDSCNACVQADEIVNTYLSRGYGMAFPVYFVNENGAEQLFSDSSLAIQVTPTILRYEQGELINRGEGVDEVFAVLDAIVQSVN